MASIELWIDSEELKVAKHVSSILCQFIPNELYPLCHGRVMSIYLTESPREMVLRVFNDQDSQKAKWSCVRSRASYISECSLENGILIRFTTSPQDWKDIR